MIFSLSAASFINISSEIKTNHIDRPIVELINHSKSMPDKGVSASCAKTRLVCYISAFGSGDISAVSTGYTRNSTLRWLESADRG